MDKETYNNKNNEVRNSDSFEDLENDIQEIDKIISDFNTILNPSIIDELQKSQKISDIIYKNKEINKKTNLLVEKYFEHLSDVDIKDEYFNYQT